MQHLKTLILAVVILFLLGNFLSTVNAQEAALVVTLDKPLEDQTFYAGPSVPRYAIRVRGQVQAADGDVAHVGLNLEILQNGQPVRHVKGQPDSLGRFEFVVTVNPQAQLLDISTDKKICAQCHDQPTYADLPSGPSTLRLTAINSIGQQTQIERHVVVESSGWAEVVVQVSSHDDRLKNLQGIPVIATTRYPVTESNSGDHQTRYFNGVTDASGNISLHIEALAQSLTTYRIYIPPTLINGILITSVDAAQLILPPGAKQADSVSIQATTTHSQLSGQLKFPTGVNPIDLTIDAIEEASGHVYSLPSSLATYTFSDLPIGRYLIAPDADQLAAQGLAATIQKVDLRSSPTAQIDLALVPEKVRTVQGTVQSGSDQTLSFGWIIDDATGQLVRLNPFTGEFSLPLLSTETRSLSIIAPGHWSQVQLVSEASSSALSIELKPQPDLNEIKLIGGGQLEVPSASVIDQTGDHLALVRGWLWGYTGDSPYTLDYAKNSITIHSNSRFAIEARPDATPWLYMLAGRGEVRLADQSSLIQVAANQMFALNTNTALPPVAVPFRSSAFFSLHASEVVPLSFESEPTLAAQVRDNLAKAGISAAQVTTLLIYSAALVIGCVAVLAMFRWWLKHRFMAGTKS